MTLGEFIAKRRKYKHLTQEQLADSLHVSKSAVAKWETNGGIPDRENLGKLASILDSSVDELYRILQSGERRNRDGINITEDVIRVLESYGYSVTKQ